MATVPLVLGGIVFQDIESPPNVNFGGEQQLVIHKLPGGKRVVDAMGPDPAPIQFAGRFQGPGAEAKARALDAMRMAGSQVPLTWSSFFFLVVIKNFEATFEAPFQVLYRVVCEVVTDPAQGALGGIASALGDLVGGDLSGAVSLVAGVAAPALATAVGNVSTAVSAIASINTASFSELAPALKAAGSAIGVAQSVSNGFDGIISALDVGAQDAASFGANLATIADAVTQQGVVQDVQSLVARVSANLSTVRG